MESQSQCWIILRSRHSLAPRIIDPINIQPEVSDDHRINRMNDTSLLGPH